MNVMDNYHGLHKCDHGFVMIVCYFLGLFEHGQGFINTKDIIGLHPLFWLSAKTLNRPLGFVQNPMNAIKLCNPFPNSKF